ncbi:MAG: AraC family transcriptional regulator [Paracoccus sp. (in: a-proteobacteria)]|uniref:helix-turn-helix domain-containing protein n=1 Tax=Paracoccus sp. TaxID=267 RepID=UPI0026E0FC45|nr:AraC family transcriptional regulator [Paracoccus sp. (in: a-proteobacteria)]MDO5612907.1 AraC family transcriptional regulator [Paracoccus sp. (in: a-proteobacteria)]
MVDLAVAGLFAGYGAVLLIRLRRTGDLPLARLGAGSLPVLIWRGLGWALIALALSDLLIAAAFAGGRPDLAGGIISFGSSLSLLALGLLSVLPAASPPPRRSKPTPPQIPKSCRGWTPCWRVNRYLDPNLTLARLARRMRLPEKRLSAAVNRATGGNVSRHINGWRIRHACGLIEGGASVTQALLDSGFNTKSNFNREFLRVTGTTPSQWATRDQA